MAGADISYQATYRQTQRALPGLIGVLAFLAAAMTLAIYHRDLFPAELTIISVGAITLIAAIFIGLNAFRVHRWTVSAHGVEISERPLVPLTGLRRKALVAFADIAAIHRVESAFDRLIEIVTAANKRYRMSQTFLEDKKGFPHPDPNANLDDFATSLRSIAVATCPTVPPITEGLSFWNRGAGLLWLAVAFAISLVLSGAVGWALWEGMTVKQPRGGEMSALVLLLPLGAGYLLLKSFRRRRHILRGRSGNL